MLIDRPTRGDPGNAVLTALQNNIRRNQNARQVVGAEQLEALKGKGNITGYLGGVTPPRGVGGAPPSPPAVVPPPPLVVIPPFPDLEPVPGSPIVTPSRMPGHGQVRPVTYRIRFQPTTISSGVLGPFTGPLIVESFALRHTINAGTSTDTYNVVRVDFSGNNSLSPIVFQATALPTGYVDDLQTLFAYNIYLDTIDTQVGQRPGWLRLGPNSTNSDPFIWMPMSVYVDISPIYIKVYAQNDTAGAQAMDVLLSVRFLAMQDPDQEGQAPDFGVAQRRDARLVAKAEQRARELAFKMARDAARDARRLARIDARG